MSKSFQTYLAIIGVNIIYASISIFTKMVSSFLCPVFHGQNITATVSVKELFPEKKRVLLETVCKDDQGNNLIEGTALVKLAE